MYVYDPRSVLIHFNPNHDKLGRFARSNFGASKTSKPVDKSKTAEYNKSDKIDKEKLKRCVKIGAGIAAASLVAIGGVYLYKSGKFSDLVNAGKVLTDETVSNLGDRDISEFGGSGVSETIKSLPGRTGLTPDKIDVDMIQSINGAGPYSEEGRDRNCAQTCVAYILNSMFGEELEAKPFSDDRELTMRFPDLRMSGVGWSKHVFGEIFDNVKYEPCKTGTNTLSDLLTNQPQGTGILHVAHEMGSHFIMYEKPEIGDVSLIDVQWGDVVSGSGGINYMQDMKGYRPLGVIDVTKAALKTTADAKAILYVMAVPR